MNDWTETQLWKHLEGVRSDIAGPIQTMLNSCMPEIEKILAKAGSPLTDFTLHDADHSFRVARRMVELIPNGILEKLSAFEIALLLLSGYLHDIGMTPDLGKVRAYHTYLLMGDPTTLTLGERDDFQEWLDDEGSGIVPPMSREAVTANILRKAGELITHFCRSRHNDWSAEWIREHADWFTSGTYHGFVDDLVRLCRSHHEYYADLVKEAFNPRIVDSRSSVVHLRYLAVLLRMADILEFDPERTPDVILRHRDVSERSLVYWYKDHQVNVVLDGNRLVASARPTNAKIHRAIELMLNDIETEMRVCRTLADETHFEVCPGVTFHLPHRWDLLATVHCEDVKPREGSYEYIDGAFRPDTERLLHLLSGVELYGTPFAAVRELLQNAFDAVREQIAYQRLELDNPSDPNRVQAIESLHSVVLRMEIKDGETWLVCTDDGVGMTKDIISRYLLISGSARRHDILDLERRCKQKGFALCRTGQFGIGVLSYFMLADRLIITTRRSQEGGGNEQTAWQFETEGIGSFGELRRDPRTRKGTEVRLRLKAGIVREEVTAWFDNLKDYVYETVRRTPCELRLTCSIADITDVTLGPGWTRILERLSSDIVQHVGEQYQNDHDLPLEHLPSSRQQERQNAERDLKEAQQQALAVLRWKSYEGELPDQMGHYRIHLPFFDIPSGVSAGFLRISEVDGKLCVFRTGTGDITVPKGTVQASWKGMRVDDPIDYLDEGWILNDVAATSLIEVDWNSSDAGGLSVNRSSFMMGDIHREVLDWLRQQRVAHDHSFLAEHRDSAYATLNHRVLMETEEVWHSLQWLIRNVDQQSPALWHPIQFPVMDEYEDIIYPERRTQFQWNDQPVLQLSRLDGGHRSARYISWRTNAMPPDAMLLVPRGYYNEVVPVWNQIPKPVHIPQTFLVACLFPPQWNQVCGGRLRSAHWNYAWATFWNKDHSLVKMVTEVAWAWCMDAFENPHALVAHQTEVENDRSRAAAWLIRFIASRHQSLWDGLCEREPEFLTGIWALLFGEGGERKPDEYTPVFFWDQEGPRTVYAISPSGWKKRNDKEVNALFDAVDDSWRLTPVKQVEEADTTDDRDA